VQVVFYRVPGERVRAVRRVLDELGALDGALSPSGDDPVILLGQAYGDTQTPCGWVEDERVAQRLRDVAPEAVFIAWEDPVYEWLGQAAASHPDLGVFTHDCDAQGRFLLDVDELCTPASTAATAWRVREQQLADELKRTPGAETVREVLPTVGVLCDHCYEDLTGQPAVCQDGCRRGLDHSGTCRERVDDDQTPCTACARTDMRLTEWDGDSDGDGDGDVVFGVSPFYPHGRCPACSSGQREDESCPNTEEDCGRARPDMVLPEGAMLHAVQRQTPDELLVFVDADQADAYAAAHDGAERSSVPVLNHAAGAALRVRTRHDAQA
jgi:hypothetical protein